MHERRTEGCPVEVKIGVLYAPRELLVETDTSAEDIEKALAKSIVDGGIFSLVDNKGSRIVVPVDKLAYLEIAEPDDRRVGFGRL
ncbi:MAG TPA: DUF3107 domain-containing protein [Frankiaceae bacterium]|jgi:hypothetical protein|nr:DUF3107 domain-containing protein [Frankiaceae bacterium]